MTAFDYHDLVRDEPWMMESPCAQTDPEIFFPNKGGDNRPAKRICNGTDVIPKCPVIAECLLYALENNERAGIWGGLTERERRRLRKRVS